MTKKLLSVFLALLMTVSAFIFTGCHKNGTTSESDKVLTSKEKFFGSVTAAAAFINEAESTLGMTSLDPALANEKMISCNLAAELKEVCVMGIQYLSKPIKITSDMLGNAQSKTYKLTGIVNAGGQDLPFNALLTSKATYFGIDKVTGKMLKIPFDKSFQVMQKLSDYLEIFKNCFGDDCFTEQKGNVTVDGTDIFDATTVDFKASAVQLSDAMIKVLTQVKTDAKLEDLFSKVQGKETQNDFFVESVEEEIKALEEGKKDLTDNDYFTFTSVIDKNVLRSLTFHVSSGDGKNLNFTMTFITKKGSNILKGIIKSGDKTYAEFSLKQKSNSSASADGELNVKIYSKTIKEDAIAIEDTIGSHAHSATSITIANGREELTVNVKYNGKKEGDKLTVNAKLEVIAKEADMTTTVPVDFVVTQEKTNDNGIKNSFDISFDAMDTKIKASVSFSEKYADMVSIDIPKDDDTIDVTSSDFDIESFLTKLSTNYSDFAQLFADLSDAITGDWEEFENIPDISSNTTQP